MSALPPALRPWSAQLDLFPEDIAQLLGPYVARLSAALGNLRPRGEAEGGEPMGHDGLTRRGPYERLLISEWLWALEAPDELVRRAAFGELAFLKPAFRQPQGARRTVALLDAGVDQLGAPRIAHLALLVVLARRAAAAGVAFSWAVLQGDPGRGPYSEVTPATVLTWLVTRGDAPLSGDQLDAWRQTLGLKSEREDAWLLCDARASRLPQATGLSRVEVSEVMTPGLRQLQVDVRPASRAARSVLLELPSPEDCVRLLRDPFRTRTTAAPVAVPTAARLRSFTFSANGRRVMLFREDGSLAALPVPRSARATIPRPRTVTPPPGHTVLAAGWRHHGGVLMLTHSGSGYMLYGQLSSAKGEAAPLPPTDRVDLPPIEPSQRPGRLLSYTGSHGSEQIVLYDSRGDGVLLRVDRERPGGPVVLSSQFEDVTEAVEVDRKVAFVIHGKATNHSPSYVRLLTMGPYSEYRAVDVTARAGETFFGWGSTRGHPELGLFAVRDRPESWHLYASRDAITVPCPTDMRVVGVGVGRPDWGGPGLITLASDQRSFYLITPERTHLLARASTLVMHAEASHTAPVLGWLTMAGEFVLWDLTTAEMLYRSTPGAR